MIASARYLICIAVFSVLILASCGTSRRGPAAPNVRLLPIDLDARNPGRTEYGPLVLLSAFELRSNDERFGGLSGLTIGPDGDFYAVSDRGHWNWGRMVLDVEGRLVELSDWKIWPMLSPEGTPLTDAAADAEALARDRDGSLLVAFESSHRIWRYAAPPLTFTSRPQALRLPTDDAAAARPNRALEALTVLADGRLLALSEQLRNADGTTKGWLRAGGAFAELSYLPSPGFDVTDCAALNDGDVIVLERRYRPFGIFSARLKLVRGSAITAGAKLAGTPMLALEYPLDSENFEAVAVYEHPINGTMIFLISDDNYHRLQRTLLLQFRLVRH